MADDLLAVDLGVQQPVESDPQRADSPDLFEVHKAVADSDPDHAAKLLSLSAKTGHAPDEIFGNETEVERAAAAPTREQFAQIKKRSPVVGKFLSVPQNMAVAYDDADNLVAHEQVNRNMEMAYGFTDSILAGLQSSILGMELRGANPNLVVSPEAPFVNRFAGTAAQFAADFPYMAAGGALGAVMGAPLGPGGAAVGGFGMSFAVPDALRETLRQHYESGDHTTVAAILRKAFTGNTLKAGVKGFTLGVMTMGAGKAAAPFGKLAASAAEIGTMTTGGALLHGETPKAEDFATNALLVGLMHGSEKLGGYGLDRAFPQRVADTVRVETTKDAAALLDSTSKASKLRARDPEGFADLMNKGKPVLIPVEAYERYFQSKGMEPERVAADLGIGESLEIARQTGGDVSIPQGAYLSKEMDTHRSGLIDDIKFSKEHLTANELKLVEEQEKVNAEARKEFVKRQGEEAKKAIAADEATKQLHAEMMDDVKARLEPRVPVDMLLKDKEKWLDANAKIVANHFIAEGARRKVDPVALYAREFPTISSGGKAAPEALTQGTGSASSAGGGESRLPGSGTQPGSETPTSQGAPSAPSAAPNRTPARSPYFDSIAEEAASRKWGFGSTEKIAASGGEIHPEIMREMESVVQGQDARELGRSLKDTGLIDYTVAHLKREAESQFAIYENAPEKLTPKQAQHILASLERAVRRYHLATGDENVPASVIDAAERFKAAANQSFVDRLMSFFGDTLQQPAFHGTPHEFDKFSVQKIGTGEGAQAYGWGLYFAGERAVAQKYRENLSKDSSVPQDLEMRNPTTGTWIKVGRGSKPAEGIHPAMVHAAQLAYFDGLRNARKYVRQWLKEAKYEAEGPSSAISRDPERGPAYYETMLGYLTAMKPGDVRGLPKGRLYHVEIPDDAVLLDWDKPLSKQPGAVRDVIKEHGLDKEFKANLSDYSTPMESRGDGNGGNLYSYLVHKFKTRQKAMDPGVKQSQTPEEQASRYLASLGIPGIKYKADQIAKRGNKGHNYVIFDENLVKIQKFEQAARGEYVPQLNEMRLGKSSDATTMMHEFMHGALEHMFAFVKSGQADAAYLAHWKAASEFLDIKPEQETLTREQHEKMARGWERYLRGEEGATKAPTKELQATFNLFRRWFTKVYRQIQGSPIEGELTPEVRGFFDRMVATEDQIAAAAQEAGYRAAEIAQLKDIEPKKLERYMSLQERARDQAENELLKEQMAELRDENQKTLASKREGFTATRFNEVANEPVFRAYSLFNPEGAAERYSQKEIWKMANDFLNNKLDPEQAAQFEAISEMSMFSDPHEMARQLLTTERAPAFEAELKKRVDADMAPFENLKDTEAIREAALKHIHENKMGELLALEYEILEEMQHDQEVRAEVSARRKVTAKMAAANAREQAKAYLETRPLREAAAYRSFITAERNAAIRVSKAIADKDFAAAAVFKGQQMLNHALASESMKARVEINKRGKYLDKFIRRGEDMLGLPQGFIAQIDAMLGHYNLKEPSGAAQSDTLLKIAQKMESESRDPRDIANATGLVLGDDGSYRPETLNEFTRRVSEDYYPIILPDTVMGSEALHQSDPNMTLGQLRDLHEAVKTVNGIGRNFERFLNDFIKMDMKTAGLQLAKRVRNNWGNRYGSKLAPGHEHQSRLMEKIAGLKDLPDAYLNDHKTMLTIAELLDGGPDGPAHDILYRPFKMATDVEQARQNKYRDELNAILAKHYKPEELAAYKREPLRFDFIKGPDGKPRTFFKDELLALARNWGNAGNRDRVMRGFKIDETQVSSMLENLSKKDWLATQDVWDHLHTFWPEIVAQEMKVNGFEPKGVDPLPFSVTVGGEKIAMKGGYYPISYDFTKSLEAYRTAQEKNALFKQYSAAAAHTDRGHTKQRVDSLGRPLRLSTDVLINHYDNVIHDLAFRQAVIDTNRFLRQPEVREAITEAIGQDGLKTIEDHVRSVASDQSEHIDGAETALRWFRFKGTMSILSLRPLMLPLNLGANAIQGIGELGPGDFRRAMSEFVIDPRQSKAFVDENSQLMKNRSQSRERDQFDAATKSVDLPVLTEALESVISPKGEVMLDKLGDTYKHWAFAADAIADQIISYPMWLFKYRSVLGETGDVQKARNMADEMIVHTFGSGREIDRMEVQRGTEWKKATSMFFSFNGMMFNRWLSQSGIAQIEARTGQRGLAAQTFAKALTFTFILPAVYETMAREFFRNSPPGESDDDKKKRIAAKMISSPFGNMWLVRDIAPVVVENAMGTGRGQFQVSPMVSALQSILDVGKGGEKLPEHAARAASMTLGSPQIINTLVFNYMDWLKTGGEITWRDFLSRRTKK